MENILTSLLSSIVSSSNNIIRMLMNNLMDICFYAENTITEANAKGSNEMLKQGAKMVTNLDDVFEEIKWC